MKNIYFEEITLKTWTWFCFKFGLYPEIINPVDAILIYRSLTVGKIPLDIDPKDPSKVISKAGGPIDRGLDFEDFK